MGFLASLTVLEIGLGALLLNFLYVVILVVHRLWLSPVASFPGPFLARATFLYEFYYQWFEVGTYYLKIKEMHEQYGPIVRITPEELHVAEPSFYHKLFVPGATRKTDHYRRFSEGTGFEDMAAMIHGHDGHRRIRAAIDPPFSLTGITRVEERIIVRVKKLCSRIESSRGSGNVMNFSHALNSLTTDIISSVFYEEPSDHLGSVDFNAAWFEILQQGTVNLPLFAHLPSLAKFFSTPLIRALTERATTWQVWDDKARRQIFNSELLSSNDAKTRAESTVFDHLVHCGLSERDFGHGGFPRFTQVIQQAGAHTPSLAIEFTLVHILMDNGKCKRLQNELKSVFVHGSDKPPSWRELKKLPYLNAVIKEGLRMSSGVMDRSPRVSPDVALQFQNWIIPPKVPVSMTSYWMHMDPKIFPSPHTFQPERWLCDAEQLREMQRYYVPFVKGSRSCVGKNLVYATMHHTIAHLFRPNSPRIELFETDTSDVIPVHGFLFPLPRLDSKGVRATIH